MAEYDLGNLWNVLAGHLVHILVCRGLTCMAITHMAGATAPDLRAYNASIIVWGVGCAAGQREGKATGITGALGEGAAVHSRRAGWPGHGARCLARMLASHARHYWQ